MRLTFKTWPGTDLLATILTTAIVLFGAVTFFPALNPMSVFAGAFGGAVVR